MDVQEIIFRNSSYGLQDMNMFLEKAQQTRTIYSLWEANMPVLNGGSIHN